MLDALYLDEINIVLISSKPIGEATVQYGGEEILLTGLSHYAVGKIENVGENQTGKELIIHSKTEEGQDLQLPGAYTGIGDDNGCRKKSASGILGLL